MEIVRPDFTAEEAGCYLGVDRKTIYKLLKSGELRGRRTYRRKSWRITRDACDDYRARQEAKQVERVERERNAEHVLYRGTGNERVPMDQIPITALVEYVDVLQKLYPLLANCSRESILIGYRPRIERAHAAKCLGLGVAELLARIEGKQVASIANEDDWEVALSKWEPKHMRAVAALTDPRR